MKNILIIFGSIIGLACSNVFALNVTYWVTNKTAKHLVLIATQNNELGPVDDLSCHTYLPLDYFQLKEGGNCQYNSSALTIAHTRRYYEKLQVMVLSADKLSFSPACTVYTTVLADYRHHPQATFESYKISSQPGFQCGFVKDPKRETGNIIVTSK